MSDLENGENHLIVNGYRSENHRYPLVESICCRYFVASKILASFIKDLWKISGCFVLTTNYQTLMRSTGIESFDHIKVVCLSVIIDWMKKTYTYPVRAAFACSSDIPEHRPVCRNLISSPPYTIKKCTTPFSSHHPTSQPTCNLTFPNQALHSPIPPIH